MYDKHEWEVEQTSWRFLGMDFWTWVLIAAIAIGLWFGVTTGSWVPCPNGSCLPH